MLKVDISLKEPKTHGTPQYPFEMYRFNTERYAFFTANHWHNEAEIIYIKSGTLHINIQGQAFIGHKGDVFFINSGELHELFFEDGPLLYYAFVFDLSFLSSGNDDFIQQQFINPLINGAIKFTSHIKSSEYLDMIIENMILINTKFPISYMLGTKSDILHILSILLDNKCYEYIDDTNTDENTQLLRDIISYIRNNYCDRILLTDIAQKFNMSPKYFCRFFKKNFKKTLIEYINNVRIESAINLLNKSDNSITKIALLCGFSNMSYFTKTFSNIVGTTPSSYRANNVE